jgi:hypothetical protein
LALPVADESEAGLASANANEIEAVTVSSTHTHCCHSTINPVKHSPKIRHSVASVVHLVVVNLERTEATL